MVCTNKEEEKDKRKLAPTETATEQDKDATEIEL
jgi:hypothetical protein